MGILIQSKTICSELLVSLLSPLKLLLGEDILVVTATVATAAQAMLATEEDISIRTMVLPLTLLALSATPSLPQAVPISTLEIESEDSVLVQDSDLLALAPEAELVASSRESAAPPLLASASTTDLTSTRDPGLTSDSRPPSPSSASTAQVASSASTRLVSSTRQELAPSA